jgi:hypothetical protein
VPATEDRWGDSGWKEAMGLLQFGEDGRFALKVANDLATRERAYGLLYALYRAKGITRSDPTGMIYSLRDAVPETTTLFVECDDRTVGVLTVYHDSPLGLPADEAYGGELRAMRSSGERLCELGALGVAPEFLANGNIVPRLFEASVLLANDIRKRTHAVVECHPSHAHLYRDLLEFEQVGSEGSLERLNGAPVVLLRKELREFECRRETGIAGAWKSGAVAEGPPAVARLRRIVRELKRMLQPMSERELRHFFIDQMPLLERAVPEHRDYILSRYPGYQSWHLPRTAVQLDPG